jgi:NAD(P) transhydrogenase subunit beta
MVLQGIVDIAFLVGALLYIIGLRLLSSPDSARRGNLYAAVGMGLAVVGALLSPSAAAGDGNYAWIAGGMVVGSAAGWVSARRVQMTAMPQMVSIFNGLGGACAVVLAGVEFTRLYSGTATYATGEIVVLVLALLIGAVSFTGSMLAFGKLQGLVDDRKVTFRGHNIFNMVLLLATIGLGTYLTIGGSAAGWVFFLIFLGITLFYGLSFVAPIGGADMPVVISLLNSLTGLSAATAGLIYDNQLMLVGGLLVGASGTILTVLMCRAMNRSLTNVLIGGFGGGGSSVAGGTDGDLTVKEIQPTDFAIQLYYAKAVMFVPGYGLAVAQAQKICKELDDLLSSNGVDVTYGIHPVAGRMPGHMNVLLAEADVPYPKLLDLEEANERLPNTDLVVIIGANDVVNTAANDDPGSPIYGMPVLEVWRAKRTVVLKRSMSTGYAGIQNPLFFRDNNYMFFGDAKASLSKLVEEVKSL